MKRPRFAFLGLTMALALLCMPIGAAEMGDFVHEWNIRVTESLALSKSGSESLSGAGTWTFAAVDERDGTLAFSHTAGGAETAEGFSGRFSILGKGKKLAWSLDASGHEQLRDRLASWIEMRLAADGLVLDEAGLALEPLQAAAKPIKVSRESGEPAATAITAKGRAAGTVDGQRWVRKFKYGCAIAFDGVKPPQDPAPAPPEPPNPPPPEPPAPRAPEVELAFETSAPDITGDIAIRVDLRDPDDDLADLECDCTLNGRNVLRKTEALSGGSQTVRYTILRAELEPGRLACTARAYDAGQRSDEDSEAVVVKTACPLYGMAFSPYLDGQSPNFRTPIGEEQIRARLSTVAGYTQWIRIFGMLDGLEKIPRIARTEFGLKVAAGIWLDGRYAAENEAGLQSLIAVARQGHMDVAVIGNETLLFGRLDPDPEENARKLVDFIERFRQAVPNVPVTTADNYVDLLRHANVMAACDQIFANIYPFHMQVPVAEAACRLAGHYLEIRAAAAGKPVVISETGWPTCGDPKGGAVPGPANAARYFLDFVTWAEGERVPYFYFEAFDELWKTEEGTVGPCWGVWSKDAVLKPGMPPVFACAGSAIDCSCALPVDGPGSPEVVFNSIPPYGDPGGILNGKARHVLARDHRIAVYIRVDQSWWVKPTYDAPATVIACDGNFSTDTATGGLDYNATRIQVYLIPAAYEPPAQGALPAPPVEIFQNALVVMAIDRTPGGGVTVSRLKP